MKVQVMVVEDEANVRNGLANFIKELEGVYQVMATASNGMEALNIMKREIPHILITDIRMPVMDGLTLIQHVKRDFPTVSVAILSGYADFDYARQALRFGVSDYLLKPINKESLVQTLNQLAAQLLKLPPGFSALHKYHKWDMTLVREESNLLESVELGDQSGVKGRIDVFFNEVRKRSHHETINAIPYYTDLMISLRKRLSFPEQLRESVNPVIERITDCFHPGLPLEKVEDHIRQCLEECTRLSANLHRNSSADIVIRCKELMEKNFDNDISLQEVAQTIGVSAAYLSRVIRKNLGMTFSEYLLRLRMKKAEHMLLHTEVKVMDIAKYVGYDNPEYFSRLFKRVYGETPCDYRARHRTEKREA